MSAIDAAMGSDYGVGKRYTGISGSRGKSGISRGKTVYEVHHMKELLFMPERRRIATHLTLQEAEAMCTLLNAGVEDG